MNEVQIIQQQLATERQHFVLVADACANVMLTPEAARDDEFVRACGEYFAFALTRLQCERGSDAHMTLEAARLAGAEASASHWREFLQVFNAQRRRRFEIIDTLLERNLPVVQWRAIAGIDADTIMLERERFGRVKATSPVAP